MYYLNRRTCPSEKSSTYLFSVLVVLMFRHIAYCACFGDQRFKDNTDTRAGSIESCVYLASDFDHGGFMLINSVRTISS